MSAAEHRKTHCLLAPISMSCLSVLLAPNAVAQPAPELAQVVTAVRSSFSCPPLKYNATVEHAAEIINQSTYAYLNHTAENVPADDPHPTAILKDLGIDSSRALSLQGAAHDEAGAIKGVLLQGRTAIPDCSYTDFGVSLLHEEQTNYVLAVVVLVGT